MEVKKEISTEFKLNLLPLFIGIYHESVDRVIESEKKKLYSFLMDSSEIQDAISAIVFSAMAVETFIYDYGATRLSRNYTKDHLDKLDVQSKWVVLPQLVTGKQFPKDGEGYELLKELIYHRNRLVHHKPTSISLLNPNFLKDKNGQFLANLTTFSQKAVLTLEKLLEDLMTIDKDSSIPELLVSIKNRSIHAKKVKS